MPEGFIFETAGNMMFFKDKETQMYCLGFLCGKIPPVLMSCLNPTITTTVGSVSTLPIIVSEKYKQEIINLTEEVVDLAREDWDSFEVSWNFKKHPLVPTASDLKEQMSSQFAGSRMEKYGLISWHFENWKNECATRFNRVKECEEALNLKFIEIYGLETEMDATVEDKDITIRVANLDRDVRSLLSYAVGCMFGRYTLDESKLAYAGGVWQENKYRAFTPDKDNCIPITDEEYFEDDIVGKLCNWLKKAYGSLTLEQNLDFIAQALGNKGNTSREVIRNYFVSDFMKDHLKIYQKRPIYWLFDSGKQNGFKALVYMHRWNEDTVGNLRVEYLHKVQHTYEQEIIRMQETVDHGRDSREVSKATKRKDKLQKQLKEVKDYDAKLAHIALSRIAINLDDGVKTNYEKVQTGRDGKKMQILAKI